MWWTSEGERVLRGAEWELFRLGALHVWELIEDECSGGCPSSWRIAVLNDLLPSQKLATLVLVSEALREERILCRDLTAHVEAMIAGVLDNIRASVEIEIGWEGDEAEQETQVFWRRLPLRVWREVDEHTDEPLPDKTCTDVDEWVIIVECLAERILWDYDFEMAKDFLDKQPDEARIKREEMGISKDYFSGIAPDPTEVELVAIRRRLRQIIGRQ
jgi:hypothetical protein